jgi:hypothetical protein
MVAVGKPVAEGGKAPVKKTSVKKQIVNNITQNTINNYFAAAPPPPPPQAQAGPSSEAAPLPGDLFPHIKAATALCCVDTACTDRR